MEQIEDNGELSLCKCNLNLDNQFGVGVEPGVYMRTEATIEEWNKLY
ncbi:hypothetical protein [Lacrimispora sp.]